jgi:cytochrome c oxidase subunit 2
MNLLIVLVVVLGIIAIAQLTKVYELTRALRQSREEEITQADNKLNAALWLVWMGIFFLSTIFLYIRYGDYLPDAASKHGVEVDNLMSVNIWIITIMFFIVNFMLFWVAYRYKFDKNRKAQFFAHSTKLEMVWTLTPAVVMAFIIVYGLMVWNDITGPASAEAIKVEVYSKQFDWTVRYPGKDNVFGSANYNLISTDNAMGMVTAEGVQNTVANIDKEIEGMRAQLETNKLMPLMPESQIEAVEDKIYRLERHKQRVMDLKEFKDPSGKSEWEAGLDDKIVKGELHVPVNKEVEFIFRSQDVIHSAYMPHFRAQMNAVPGVPTRFKMTPTITTKEMRKKMNNDKFDYILLCNKVCGAAHFNMKIKVVVEDEADYLAWMETQKEFKPKTGDKPGDSVPSTTPADSTGAKPMAMIH